MPRFNATQEELNVFLDELEEQLQILEENIIRLEKEEDLKYLSEIFRIAHTIKGSSASIGYQQMTDLTHILENILDRLNRRKLTLNRDIVEALFDSLDALKLLKKSMETGKEIDFDLDALIKRFEVMGRESKETVLPGFAPSQANVFKELERKSREALAQKQYLFDISVSFVTDCELPIVRAFQVCLEIEKHGQIFFSTPTVEELKRGEVSFSVFRVLLAAFSNKMQIETIVKGCCEVDKVTLAQVAGSQLAALIAALQVQVTESAAHLDEKHYDSGESVPVKVLTTDTMVPGLKKSSKTVRVSVEILDILMNLVGELVIDRTRLVQLGTVMETSSHSSNIISDLMETSLHISKITNELQEQIMKARMVSIDMIFNKFPRMVRDLSRKTGKEVNFVMEGGDTELDRAVIEEISDPLIHLLRNSLDHGIETPEDRKQTGKSPKGLIYLGAYHEENHIVITIRDDGRGINIDKIREKAVQRGIMSAEQLKEMMDREVLDIIFLPGFSTSDTVSDVSGRGVGMDIVKTNLQKIGGNIDIATDIGKGTTFIIRIPLTLAIMPALLVTAKQIVFAIPLGSIAEIVKVPKSEVQSVSGHDVFTLRGEVVPLASLMELFNEPTPGGPHELNVVVVAYGDNKVGIIADMFMGKQEVVIKTMGQYIGDLPGISGVTILGDGSIGLIVDVISFINSIILSRRQLAKKAS